MNINNNFRWERCPLCHASRFSLLGDIEYRKPLMFSTHHVDLEGTPSLYKCDECGSWFAQNIISEETAMALYESGESNSKWPRELSFVEEKSENIIKRLSQYFLAGKKVLDVGCNTGALLDYARSRGCNTYGVEPSISSRMMLESKGHTSFDSFSEVKGVFDVITAFDLVEHLYDLPGFVTKVHGLLANGGVFILLTGDNTSLSARLSKNNWWYVKAPEHIIFPSKKYLQNMVGFNLHSIDDTFASIGYRKSLAIRIAQLVRKYPGGGYDGFPPLSQDHMLVVLGKE